MNNSEKAYGFWQSLFDSSHYPEIRENISSHIIENG